VCVILPYPFVIGDIVGCMMMIIAHLRRYADRLWVLSIISSYDKQTILVAYNGHIVRWFHAMCRFWHSVSLGWVVLITFVMLLYVIPLDDRE
jgi:hypothetical protein